MQKETFVKSFKIYLIFTASGASALIYQVIWARWMGLVFGNTTTSVSIILGSFMTGLALGSWIAGRLLHRIDNPMRFYAYMEIGIGIFAFCFPLISKTMEFIFSVTVTTESPTAYSLSIRTILAFILLLIPTTFMGATLPLLTDFFRRSPRHTFNWKVGLLYAVNTLGAAIGILAAGFILIELLGVFVTNLIAAFLNILIALLAYKFSRSSKLIPKDALISYSGKLDAMGKFAVCILAASGATALASEVLWTRTMETLVGNSTYAFSMIVLLYLVGIAAGSWIMSLIVNRLKSLPLWLATLQVSMGIWTIIAIFLFDVLIKSISRYNDVLVSLSVIFWNYLKAMSILIPLSLLSGACFPIATRIIDPKSEDASGVLIAGAYSWNTIGALSGSLIAGFLIAPLFDYIDSIYFLALLYCLIGVIAYITVSRSDRLSPYKQPVSISFGVLSLAVIGFALINISGEDHYVKRFNSDHPLLEMVYHEPGLQGVTSVIKLRNERLASILLVNGKGMTVKITDTKMMAHLPMLLHPNPENTLVICFGMGTTYRSAISHGGRVTVVELVNEVLDAFDYFYDDAARIRSYPKGKMIVNDGRNFLKLTHERFDVITVDPPPPIDAAGVNNLHSKEFMELAKSRLANGGIMAHWFPYPHTKAGVDDWDTFNMLVSTFLDVFPHVYAQTGFHNVGLHIIGSEVPLEFTMDRLQQRLSNKKVLYDLTEWDQIPSSYFSDLKIVKKIETSSPGLLVTDDRPRLEFYLMNIWKKGGEKRHATNNW